jgi:hypothetical protein
VRVALVLAAVYGALLNGSPRGLHGTSHDPSQWQRGGLDRDCKAIVAKAARGPAFVDCRRSGSPDDMPAALVAPSGAGASVCRHAVVVQQFLRLDLPPPARRSRSASPRGPPVTQS